MPIMAHIQENRGNIMKTQLISYSLDTDSPEYKAVLEATKNHKPMHASGGDHKTESGEIELDTKCFFDNQWNTADDSPSNPGARVFDWYESVVFNNGKEIKTHKRGHYLVITEEMKELRDNTVKCGYCGHMEQLSESEFCSKCIGSSYLEEKLIHLLRLKPVSYQGSRKELTKSEAAILLPEYVEAQTKTKKAESKAARQKELDKINSLGEKAKAKAERLIKKAENEYNGMIWLWENEINTDNCIYYDHTGVFNFGWRKPFMGAAKEALLNLLAEFPYEYTIEDKER
jgi:hypothetical protein